MYDKTQFQVSKFLDISLFVHTVYGYHSFVIWFRKYAFFCKYFTVMN